MTDINDKSFRQTLIERFLNCDTTVAEERELALFYAERIKADHVPEDEKSVCALVMATVTSAASDNLAEAHEPTGIRHTLCRLHWRWMAAACVAAIIAVGAAVKFAAYNNESTMLATSDNTVRTPHVDEISKTQETKTQETKTQESKTQESKTQETGTPSAIDICAKNNSDGQHTPLSSSRVVRRQSTSPQLVASKTDAARSDASSTVDMNGVCSLAVAAFCDANSITIERKGEVVLLTTADSDGTCQRYVVGDAGDGQMTIAGL